MRETITFDLTNPGLALSSVLAYGAMVTEQLMLWGTDQKVRGSGWSCSALEQGP